MKLSQWKKLTVNQQEVLSLKYGLTRTENNQVVEEDLNKIPTDEIKLLGLPEDETIKKTTEIVNQVVEQVIEQVEKAIEEKKPEKIDRRLKKYRNYGKEKSASTE